MYLKAQTVALSTSWPLDSLVYSTAQIVCVVLFNRRPGVIESSDCMHCLHVDRWKAAADHKLPFHSHEYPANVFNQEQI